MSESSHLGSEESGSSSSDSSERNVYHFIIPSPDGKELLGIVSGKKAKLPSFRSPEEGQEFPVLDWESYPCVLLDCIKCELGMDCFIVRPVWKHHDSDYCAEEVVLVLEIKDYGFPLPKGSKWISRHFAEEFDWGEMRCGMQVQRVVNSFFTDTATTTSPGVRPPWRFPGWFRDTEKWVETQLKANNYWRQTEPFRQITHTFKATVFNCSWGKRGCDHSSFPERKTNGFIIKTSIHVFREAKLTSVIAGFATDIVPEVIAVDKDRNLFIQRDVGAFNPRRFHFGALIRTVGELQISSMQHVQELRDEGMEALDTEWLLCNIPKLLHHPALDKLDNSEFHADLEWLRDRIFFILELCHELLRIGIPNTLVHGDLHLLNVGGQVSIPDGKYRIFDWEWSFIGHPFQDFDTIYRNSQEYGINGTSAMRLYFKYWESFASVAELERAVDIAHAMSLPILLYRWQQLFDNTEKTGSDRPLGEMGDIISEFRVALEELQVEDKNEP